MVTGLAGARAQRSRTCHDGLTIAHLRSLPVRFAGNHDEVATDRQTPPTGPPYAAGLAPSGTPGWVP
ncbi:hypothetical protein IDVR_07600 [Intrasporangium sp. DVR]